MTLFDNMTLFTAICEHGSLAAAARELGLSPARVSERLAALEAELGVRLINRTTRSLSLTEEGRTFLADTSPILTAVEDLQRRMSIGRDDIAGHIRISVTHDLGRHRIMGYIDAFVATNPLTTIDVFLSDTPVDIVAEGIDLAVRYGTLPDSTLISQNVLVSRRVLCASPHYLEKMGTPERLDDLQNHHCLIMRKISVHPEDHWALQEDGQPRNIAVKGYRICNDGDVVARWAIDGHGIAYKALPDVFAAIQSGALLEVLSHATQAPYPLQIVFPANRLIPRRVRAMVDHLTEQLKRDFGREVRLE